ncbi:MAG: tripartite tricarboxylate transporter substrate binding protein [Pseudomonadota bacterium]
MNRISKIGVTRRGVLAASAAALALPSAPAFSQQAFPSRPIKMIVPYPAGGTTDAVARVAADLMSKTLGQPIIVDNKGGANAILGSTLAARSEPDGYTILFGTDANLVLNGLLYKNLAYDAERDFTPIGLIVDVPQILAVSPTIPPRTIKEFVQYAKANPGKLNFGTAGRGGNGHLAAELFMHDFNVEMTSVPFGGGAQALNAILAGTVQVLFGTMSSALPQVQAGKLIALAVTTARRNPLLPDVPTVAESGAPGYEAALRYGLVAPKKTPAPVVERLQAALSAALVNPILRQPFEKEGYVVYQPHAPALYATANRNGRETWGKLIRAKGLDLD